MQVTENANYNSCVDSMAGILTNGNGVSPEMAGAEGTVKNASNAVYPKTPYVKIVEQPASKALRFRYECEGRSAGSIPGAHNTPENKTYPTIQIIGYKGPAVVVVSCVTKDEPYRAHPHNLVGKECKEGVCTVKIENESMTATFSNLGIQCVKKKDIEEALKTREKKRVDPFRQGFSHSAHPSSIDLNAVRLCFQGFLNGSEPKKFNVLPPVVSDPIYDKKAMSDLVITKLSHSSASVEGGQEIILLCEKVAKEDIQVRFYDDGSGWEAYGDFTPSQVHKQVAIYFKTPAYQNKEVDQKVKVHIQLKRPSDGATSEPLPFHFIPVESGKRAFRLLRSLKPDYDILANILADLSHPLTKEILALQRGTADSDEEDDSEDYTATDDARKGNANSGDDEENNENDEKGWSPSSDDEETNSVRETSVSIKEDDTMLKTGSNDLSSKEAVDNLSVVSQDKLKELGVVFSESEESDGDQSLQEKFFKEFARTVSVMKSSKEKEVNVAAAANNDDGDDDIDIDSDRSNSNFGLYTSLQMAMMNRIQIPDRETTSLSKMKYLDTYEVMAAPPRPSSVKPDLKKLSANENETLPPLPPKRIKKNPPFNRSLPALPQKETKLALIQKLFFSKKKKSKSNDASAEKVSCENLSRKSLSERRLSSTFDADSLTEAEHYALYTTFAPRATDSEFDENSCYYSPVEAEPIK